MTKLLSVSLVGLFFSVITACHIDSPNSKDEKVIQERRKFRLPDLPTEITFCGRTYKLDNFDVRERLDKEIIVNTYFHSSTIQSLKRANRYFETLSQSLKKNNVPEDFKYLCLIESNLTQAVSPSGAKGFWQFMPQTGKEYGLVINEEVDERLNIAKSTDAACNYLTDAYQKLNDWMLTAAAYNRGVSGIKKDLESQFVSSYFDLHLNEETSRYVFRILALKLIYENPELYGFELDDIALYDVIKTEVIEVDEEIDIAKWAKDHGTTYRMVKLLNPWIVGRKLSKNKYKIEIPVGGE